MANDDFTFDDKHSFSDMGLITEIKSFPLFAEPKTIYEDLPGTDGELDFCLSNPKERLCFKPRIIELECHFAEKTDFDFTKKMSELASWLVTNEPKILIFDNETNTEYVARVANLFNVERITDFSGTFPLVFKCKPFKYKVSLTIFGKTGTGTFEVNVSNNGYYCPLYIDAYCSASGGFSVYNKKFPDKILSVNHQGNKSTPFQIDTGEMTVIYNNTSITHKCSGDFFELAPGDNTLVFSAPGNEIKTEVYFQERFL